MLEQVSPKAYCRALLAKPPLCNGTWVSNRTLSLGRERAFYKPNLADGTAVYRFLRTEIYLHTLLTLGILGTRI